MALRRRHLVKAVSYRIFGSIATVGAAIAVTGDAHVGLAVGAIDTIAKIGLYYLHERAWFRIKWGTPDH